MAFRAGLPKLAADWPRLHAPSCHREGKHGDYTGRISLRSIQRTTALSGRTNRSVPPSGRWRELNVEFGILLFQQVHRPVPILSTPHFSKCVCLANGPVPRLATGGRPAARLPPHRREPHDRPAPSQARTELTEAARPPRGNQVRIMRRGSPWMASHSSRYVLPIPWIGVSSHLMKAWTVKDWTPLGPHHSCWTERCCDALAGAHLEADARNDDIGSAPVALCKRSLHNGIATLREASRIGSRSAMAQTIRHVGLDIDHKLQPLSSARALAQHPKIFSYPQAGPADYPIFAP